MAAAAPLVLARGVRFRWAARFWSIALVFWLLAWVIGRGWTGGLAIDPLVLLGPAAAATAAAIGLGVAAFERDLRAAEFGWRQLVTVVATVGRGASARSPRWSRPCPAAGTCRSTTSASRWPGCTPRRPPGRSGSCGSATPGPSTRARGTPATAWPTPPRRTAPPTPAGCGTRPGPGPAAGLASAVDLARAGRTDQLGRLLAPAGVRYVVVLTSLAPEIAGEQTPTEYPVPADLVPALSRQLDLEPGALRDRHHRLRQHRLDPERAEVAPGTRCPPRRCPTPWPVLPAPVVVPGRSGPARAVGVAVLLRAAVGRHRARRGGAGRSLDAVRSRVASRRCVRPRSAGPPSTGWPPPGTGILRLRRRDPGPTGCTPVDRGVAGGGRPPDRTGPVRLALVGCVPGAAGGGDRGADDGAADSSAGSGPRADQVAT